MVVIGHINNNHGSITSSAMLEPKAARRSRSRTSAQCANIPADSLLERVTMSAPRSPLAPQLPSAGSTAPITFIKLKDDTKVSIQDHVYLRSEVPYEPYYIGRVLEFLPHPKFPAELQVRVAWFYRPKDVLSGRRKHWDPRLIVATMHTDLNPVTSIRGLCTVKHEAHVPDLEGYKKSEDHFYYNQLFDRYCRAAYDVVPCENVRNLPADIAQALRERFEFILVEEGRAGEFTEEHQVCKFCSNWASNKDSLRCAVCAHSFHMKCLEPPLTRKPPKGYSWVCAACLLSQREAREEEDARSVYGDRGAKTAAAAAVKQDVAKRPYGRSREVAKPEADSSDRLKSPEEESPISNTGKQSDETVSRYTLDVSPTAMNARKEAASSCINQKWPFRYFGVHTNMADVFDDHARINPRNASRIGPKYQCLVPSYEPEEPEVTATTPVDGELADEEPDRICADGGRASRRLRRISRWANVLPTNGDARRFGKHVLERGIARPIFALPSSMSENQLEDYLTKVRAQPRPFPCPPHSVDLLDRALAVLGRSNYDPEVALRKMQETTRKDLGVTFAKWSEKEKHNFEECMMLYGHDLVGARRSVPTRSSKEIVQFFYTWKKSERYIPVYSVYTKKCKPNKRFKFHGVPLANAETEETAEEDDDETAPLAPGSVPRTCSNCGTRRARGWRKAPPAHMLDGERAANGEVNINGNLVGNIPTDKGPKLKTFCDECSAYWFKYGYLRPLPSASAKKIDDGRKASMKPTTAPVVEAKQKRPYKKRKRADTTDQLAARTALVFDAPTGPCDVCLSTGERFGQLPGFCVSCGLTVHGCCYGVPGDVPLGTRWTCDVCRNCLAPKISTTYSCVLCQPSKRSCIEDTSVDQSSVGIQLPMDMTTSSLYPRTLKPTVGNNWAHLLCATWIPEVRFGNAARMEPVENIGFIQRWRWEKVCCICHTPGGACVTCAGQCGKHFHVSCARASGLAVVFDLMAGPALSSGMPISATAKEKERISPPLPASIHENWRDMIPSVWCLDHRLQPTNHLTPRDTLIYNEQPQSALTYFLHQRKRCDSFGTGAMRKAKLIHSMTRAEREWDVKRESEVN